MDRKSLFGDALLRCKDLSKKYPHINTIKSIIAQIEYLTKLNDGSLKDHSRLKDVILGVQAAREIEPLDQETAELLHKVSKEARLMGSVKMNQ